MTHELPLQTTLPMEQPCSTPGCASKEVQTVTIGRVELPPEVEQREYFYTGFCCGCRQPRFGAFFVRGEDLTVEVALDAIEREFHKG
jgi:hypothetical protein